MIIEIAEETDMKDMIENEDQIEKVIDLSAIPDTTGIVIGIEGAIEIEETEMTEEEETDRQEGVIDLVLLIDGIEIEIVHLTGN